MARKKIHILGICGTFMGSIALLARELGFQVTGSDENIYPPMSDHLFEQGIEIMEGYKVKELPKADEYIVGNALSRGNEVIEYLLDHNVNFISGPAWLAQNILNKKKVVAVSGTHGKTTTTAMITWILEFHGIDAGYLIAGKPKNFETSSRLGSSEIFIIEADEYDTAFFDKRAKFIHYLPDILILNNLEFDHGDIYVDIHEIQRQFHHLIRTMSSKSCIICPASDKRVEEVLKLGLWSKLVQYGKNPSLSNYYQKIESDYSSVQFSLEHKKVKLDWTMFGEHNARNALSSILSTQELGVPLSISVEALKKFSGVSRRQEILFNEKNIVFVDDFAHHPTAIKNTLDGLRKKVKKGRIIALIELRSNTMQSGLHDKKLKNSVENADFIYWKGKNKDQVNSLIESNSGKSKSINSIDETVIDLMENIRSGDLIITMSNGDFGGLIDKLSNSLRSL